MNLACSHSQSAILGCFIEGKQVMNNFDKNSAIDSRSETSGAFKIEKLLIPLLPAIPRSYTPGVFSAEEL
jgi:hypothetical protein